MTYEFGPAENKTIDGVGMRGLLIGILLILIAVASITRTLALVDSDIVLSTLTMIQDIVLILIAIAFLLPFLNFRKIAKTESKDINEFMDGIRKMTLGFIIIIVATLATVITEVIRLLVTL